ncbi:oxidoreductase [Fodinicola feengrottensis]|uniref:Oxidoreductase n=1 Tax=Fodinicola feengrottensis TaxID=435914 RepID=A0ABN2HGI4_9ACTN|nr:oxidoreductase [Fodinicola feengrottensis]
MSVRVWFVTGASAGFGRAIAVQALAAGDTVVAAVRRPESVKDLVESAPDRVTAVQLDVTDKEQITAAVARAMKVYGHIDVLVNNAGRGIVGAAEEIADQELRDLMNLHLFGPAEIVRQVLPAMRARGRGAIVQMSSQVGRYAFGGISAYAGTKFALEGWSEALAEEVRPFGVHVMIVEPGPFRTSFNERDVLEFTATGEVYRELLAPVRAALTQASGAQAGDPVRAAKAILTALDAERPPLRLVLGNEAVDTIAASLDRARAELAEWESLARSADYPA